MIFVVLRFHTRWGLSGMLAEDSLIALVTSGAARILPLESAVGASNYLPTVSRTKLLFQRGKTPRGKL